MAMFVRRVTVGDRDPCMISAELSLHATGILSPWRSEATQLAFQNIFAQINDALCPLAQFR